MLVKAKKNGDTSPGEVASWITNMDESLDNRLVALGLVPSRHRARHVPLDEWSAPPHSRPQRAGATASPSKTSRTGCRGSSAPRTCWQAWNFRGSTRTRSTSGSRWLDMAFEHAVTLLVGDSVLLRPMLV